MDKWIRMYAALPSKTLQGYEGGTEFIVLNYMAFIKEFL